MNPASPSPARKVRRTVRAKLVSLVLISTVLALLVAGVAMLVHDLVVQRKSWATDVATEASILALSTAPALAFDDRRVAQRNLQALSARPAVSAAALYTPDGELYAHFTRDGEPPPPQRLPAAAEDLEIAGERVQLVRRVEQNGEWLGTIYLIAHYDVWSRVRAYLGIFAVATLLSLVAVLALSAALQRMITVPLDAIIAAARKIVHERDYSVRAGQPSDDEIGLVVGAFNNMLDEVQARTAALESTNASLRKSEQLYRAIGESLDFGVWICDAEGRAVYLSDSFLRLTGMTQEQCVQYGWGTALHPDDAAATLAAWQECVRTGGTWYREHRYRGVDGQYHPVLAQGVAIRAENGTVLGWAGINLDISRLKRTEEALREADRRKDEFLATLAHELRNPLAPIRNATKILESERATDAQRSWAQEVIARQVQHMALLLDDLLDVSRITRGRLELRREHVGLDKLVASAVETARPLIDAKRHTLRVDLPADPIDLDVDPLRISQSLSNLLTNAAKYTDPGGHITVSARLGSDGLSISVRDDGIGLSPAALTSVFEMFSQVESAIERSQGGLGIGLALVRGLVGLHGGSVEAVSAGLGQGSTFTIRLPHGCIVWHALPLQRAPTHPELRVIGPRRIALVADDNRDAADSLALLLHTSGHTVHLAHGGVAAVEVALREKPEIAVLDIGMPDLSGYEVAQQIRAQPWGGNVLLIAVTGWGQREDIERAMAAGFDHHLTKPVDLHELERLIAAGGADARAHFTSESS